MVKASDQARAPKGDNKQIDEAEEAKEEAKEAEPKTDDPAYMPNLEPQTGEGE